MESSDILPSIEKHVNNTSYDYFFIFIIGLFLAFIYFYRENLEKYFKKMKENIYKFFIKQHIKNGTMIQTTKVAENSSLAQFLQNIGIYRK
jgi:hypothetical protein